MSEKKSGIPAKTRLIMGMVVVSTVVIGFIGLSMFGERGTTPADIAGTAQVNNAPAEDKLPKSLPGDQLALPETSDINQAIREEQEKKLEAAEGSRNSFITSLEQLNEEKNDILEQQQVQAPPRVSTGLDDVRQQPVQQQQALGIPAPLYSIDPSPIDQALDALIQSTTAPRTMTVVASGYTRPEPAPEIGLQPGSPAPVDTGVPTGPFERVNAGSISYAVLKTAVNSDEPGPVLAEIAAGPLRGATLMGSHQSAVGGQSMVIVFNRLVFKDKEYGIEAYGVDPKTSRTALADAVDNHYLERYGMLIAASFMEGLAGALTETTSTVNAAGNEETVTQPIDEVGDRTLVALGNVGSTFVPIMQQRFNRPPTVMVYAGGGMGVLFMNSLDVSLN